MCDYISYFLSDSPVMFTVLSMQYMLGNVSAVLLLYRRQFGVQVSYLSDRNIGLVQGFELTRNFKKFMEFSGKIAFSANEKPCL